MTPRRRSKSQIQTVMAATTGIAQASSRPTCRMRRTTRPTACMSSASRMPMPTVTKAVMMQNTSERTTTAQSSGFVASVT